MLAMHCVWFHILPTVLQKQSIADEMRGSNNFLLTDQVHREEGFCAGVVHHCHFAKFASSLALQKSTCDRKKLLIGRVGIACVGRKQSANAGSRSSTSVEHIQCGPQSDSLKNWTSTSAIIAATWVWVRGQDWRPMYCMRKLGVLHLDLCAQTADF